MVYLFTIKQNTVIKYQDRLWVKVNTSSDRVMLFSPYEPCRISVALDTLVEVVCIPLAASLHWIEACESSLPGVE